MHRQWFCENHYGRRESKTLSLHICEWLTWQSQICDNKQIKCHVRPCPTEIKRFRWKTVRQSATLNRAVLQGRQYASKHCKSSRKQSRNDRERLWERTTNSRICLQTSDNVRVQRGNISALRSTWNMSTNCGGSMWHNMSLCIISPVSMDEAHVRLNQTDRPVINFTETCLATLNVNTSHPNVSSRNCPLLDFFYLPKCEIKEIWVTTARME